MSDGKDLSEGSSMEKYREKRWQGMRPGRRTSKSKPMEGKGRRLILIAGFSTVSLDICFSYQLLPNKFNVFKTAPLIVHYFVGCLGSAEWISCGM